MKRHVFLAGVASVTILLAACGGDDGGSAEVSPTTAAAGDAAQAAPDPAAAAVVIDVRTPEEFAAGHLSGAVNLNVEDGTLAAALPGLDPSATYSVYCRSGRRSAAAAELMGQAGFTNVTDLGALDAAAAATGLAVVAG
jgi:phage shock protein E